jgi:hypothetical protein
MAQIVLGVICLLRSLNALASLVLAAMGGLGSMAGPMGFLINAGLGTGAGWLLWRSIRRDIRSSWVLAFLSADLIAYPLTGLLGLHGWYPLGSPMMRVLGPVLAAVLHYGFLLLTILWLGSSKPAQAHLSGGDPLRSG